MSRVARSPRGSYSSMKRSLRAVEQIAARAAQSFLEHGARHARARAGEQARGMELHHLHVAQREPGAQRHREAVAALVARGRVEAVHRRTAAGGEQHRSSPARRRIRPRACRSSARRRCAPSRVLHELDRAMLLEALDARDPHLLGEAVDDLDAGEVALVHGAVEGLARRRPSGARVPSGLRSKKQPSSFSSSWMRSIALVTSVQARSWSGSHLPPSIVSMKWRSTESPGASATL